MSSTEIINRTSQPVNLKVGNNLVFTDLSVLKPGESYKVHVDPNATYQEYYMGKDRTGRVLIISSDDCIDNKSITIDEEENGSYTLQKQPRAANANRTGSPAMSAANSNSSRSVGRSSKFSGVLKFFSFRQ